MPSYIDIGIIPDIEPDKDYSDFNSYRKIKKIYNCISINDEELSSLIAETYEKKLKASYCSLDNTGDFGIDLCGITLFSPDSVNELIKILQSNPDYSKTKWYDSLYQKCLEASDKNKYMIFLGV